LYLLGDLKSFYFFPHLKNPNIFKNDPDILSCRRLPERCGKLTAHFAGLSFGKDHRRLFSPYFGIDLELFFTRKMRGQALKEQFLNSWRSLLRPASNIEEASP
jgi:hypothetical protein